MFAVPPIVAKGESITLSADAEERYHPKEYTRKSKLFLDAIIYGTRPDKILYPKEEEAAAHVARLLKYFFEDILPLCTSIRLRKFKHALETILSRSNSPSKQATYIDMVREQVDLLGGIDTTMMEDTMAHPLLHPVFGDELMFMPAWLRALNKTLGKTGEDMLASFHEVGSFDPFPISNNKPLFFWNKIEIKNVKDKYLSRIGAISQVTSHPAIVTVQLEPMAVIDKDIPCVFAYSIGDEWYRETLPSWPTPAPGKTMIFETRYPDGILRTGMSVHLLRGWEVVDDVDEDSDDEFED
nr:hypothetical protein [Candidatus Sigynarchaeum springense]